MPYINVRPTARPNRHAALRAWRPGGQAAWFTPFDAPCFGAAIRLGTRPSRPHWGRPGRRLSTRGMSMATVWLGLGVAVLTFVFGVGGLLLQRLLPETHSVERARDMIGAI